MKEEAPRSHKKIANKRNQKDIIMFILYTVANALKGKVHEEKVRKSIHDFGGIYCGIVVLANMH
jgi:hypothetical protein